MDFRHNYMFLFFSKPANYVWEDAMFHVLFSAVLNTWICFCKSFMWKDKKGSWMCCHRRHNMICIQWLAGMMVTPPAIMAQCKNGYLQVFPLQIGFLCPSHMKLQIGFWESLNDDLPSSLFSLLLMEDRSVVWLYLQYCSRIEAPFKRCQLNPWRTVKFNMCFLSSSHTLVRGSYCKRDMPTQTTCRKCCPDRCPSVPFYVFFMILVHHGPSKD